MKRRMSRAFSLGILAVAIAAAELFPAQQAQAQTLHYGPGGGDGVEIWATPQAGGYQVKYNTAGGAPDGDTSYSGFLKIVRTAGGTNYVQGVVEGGGNTYTIGPASYFTVTEHYYDGSWLHQENGRRSERLNLNSDSPAPPPTVSITAPSSGATYTVSYNAVVTVIRVEVGKRMDGSCRVSLAQQVGSCISS